MRRLFFKAAALGLLLLAGGRPARAANSAAGTSGAQFLKIAPGARPAGLGDAFAGAADDAHAVYFNPAGLGTLRKVEVTGMHDTYFQSINYEFAAVAVPMLSWVDSKQEKNAYGTLGMAIYNLNVSNIEQRGVNETDQPLSSFGSSDFAYALSYGYSLGDSGLSLGATAKFIDQNLNGTNGTAFASDAGALFRTGGLGIGAGVRNAGTASRLGSVADPLPLTAYGGAAFKPNEELMGTIEVDVPRDHQVGVGFGAEYKKRFIDRLTGAVRAGYNTGQNDAGGWSGAGFGLGVGYGNLTFDFTLAPFGELGNTYRYSLGAKF